MLSIRGQTQEADFVRVTFVFRRINILLFSFSCFNEFIASVVSIQVCVRQKSKQQNAKIAQRKLARFVLVAFCSLKMFSKCLKSRIAIRSKKLLMSWLLYSTLRITRQFLDFRFIQFVNGSDETPGEQLLQFKVIKNNNNKQTNKQGIYEDTECWRELSYLTCLEFFLLFNNLLLLLGRKLHDGCKYFSHLL